MCKPGTFSLTVANDQGSASPCGLRVVNGCNVKQGVSFNEFTDTHLLWSFLS